MQRLLFGATRRAARDGCHSPALTRAALRVPRARQLQSDALRRSVKKLVAHFGGAQPYGYAGVLVGLRQYTAPADGRGAQRGTSLDRWLAEAQAGWR